MILYLVINFMIYDIIVISPTPLVSIVFRVLAIESNTLNSLLNGFFSVDFPPTIRMGLLIKLADIE